MGPDDPRRDEIRDKAKGLIAKKIKTRDNILMVVLDLS